MPEIIFKDARVIDGTGADAYTASVVVSGSRITRVVRDGVALEHAPDATVIEAAGKTLMPGLIEAHCHPSFGDTTTLEALGEIPPEEHTLLTARNVKLLFDHGFTSLFCAASAKIRVEMAVRNEINAGLMQGPRMLVASPEMTVTGGVGDVRLGHLYRHSVELICDGPDEFRRTARMLTREGVDTLKIDISGDEFVPYARAGMTTMNDAEVAAVCEVARSKGKRVAAHARSAESVKMCVRHGVEIVYHADLCDEEALDMLEERRDHHFVAPALGLIHSMLHEASEFGITPEVARAMGLEDQMELAVKNMMELKRRGVRVLPGGDYGFAWIPMGTNARDLEHFVNYLGFTPMEAIVSATKLGGELMLQPDDLGCVVEGYLADLLLVDGDPLKDIACLQRKESFLAIMKDGVFHKAPTARQSGGAQPPAFDATEARPIGDEEVAPRTHSGA